MVRAAQVSAEPSEGTTERVTVKRVTIECVCGQNGKRPYHLDDDTTF